MSRILAIDPGYDKLGVAVLDTSLGVGKEKILFSDCIKTSSENLFEDRLLEIYNSVKKIVSNQKPSILAIESLYLSTNKKTVMRVAEARGVIILAAKEGGLQIFEYSPLQVKLAITSHGKSSKRQMKDMLTKIIDLNKKDIKDDELDAIAIGITHNAIAKIDRK